MGLFTKKRKDADWVKPNDAIGTIMPYIMPKRTEAEVSCKVDMDVTEVVKYLEKYNKEDHEYKMTYFHAIASCFAKTAYSRPKLNRFIKDKKLYQRKILTFGFIAKDKLSDNGEERIVCLEVEPKDNIITLSRKMAIDVFKVRQEGTNDMDGILNTLTALPKWLLTIIVKLVFFLDEKGISPKFLTEGDTNYVSMLFSNLGSIKSNSIYHHLNNYGTNSIVVTIGTIREEKGRKIVDLQITLDERIADGFYFVKSIQLAEYIAGHPELLEEEFSKIVEE